MAVRKLARGTRVHPERLGLVVEGEDQFERFGAGDVVLVAGAAENAPAPAEPPASLSSPSAKPDAGAAPYARRESVPAQEPAPAPSRGEMVQQVGVIT